MSMTRLFIFVVLFVASAFAGVFWMARVQGRDGEPMIGVKIDPKTGYNDMKSGIRGFRALLAFAIVVFGIGVLVHFFAPLGRWLLFTNTIGCLVLLGLSFGWSIWNLRRPRELRRRREERRRGDPPDPADPTDDVIDGMERASGIAGDDECKRTFASHAQAGCNCEACQYFRSFDPRPQSPEVLN
jgi:hypothetical protein